VLREHAVETLADRIDAAEAGLARLEETAQLVPLPQRIIDAFSGKEALAASAEGGNKGTLSDVLVNELTKQPGSSSTGDIEDIMNHLAATQYELDKIHAEDGRPYFKWPLNDCHRILLRGQRHADQETGEFCQSQNWVGGQSPGRHRIYVPLRNSVFDNPSFYSSYKQIFAILLIPSGVDAVTERVCGQ
jgi:hypothetical protein